MDTLEKTELTKVPGTADRKSRRRRTQATAKCFEFYANTINTHKHNIES